MPVRRSIRSRRSRHRVGAREGARLAGDDPSLAYAEYSLDFEHPDDVPDEVGFDPELWRQVNIAIGRGRVLEEHMGREFRALGRREFVSSCSA
jgi:hypothetical protein